MNKIKLAIIGFGNAAQAFSGNSKGTIIKNSGIDLQTALNGLHTGKTFANSQNLNTFEMLEKAEADVVIELSPLSIRVGQPAIDHIKTAFGKGMHVITPII